MKCSYPIWCSLIACILPYGCNDTVVGRPLLADVDTRDELTLDLSTDATDGNTELAPQDVPSNDVDLGLDLSDLELSCDVEGYEALCGGECVDASSDPQNCNGCGRVCADVKWGCRHAYCGCPCPAGLGCCENPEAPDGFDCPGYGNAFHCGGCGIRCGPNEFCDVWDPAGSRCECSDCDVCTCEQGSTCCPTGCTNLSTDRWNCGACGNVCAGRGCIDGQCQ